MMVVVWVILKVCCTCSLPIDDSDEDSYVATPKSPVPVAPKKRRNWLPFVKKQTNDDNPLFAPKVGASPSDLADSRVSQLISAVAQCCLIFFYL